LVSGYAHVGYLYYFLLSLSLLRYIWDDSDIMLSAKVNAAMLEVFTVSSAAS